MAQDQGTYPGLCLLTDSDGKVITIEDSVSHDTVVFTHTNTGEGEFAICYPEVLGSGVPEAALANFGTHNVENTATEGYAFTLGDEEYLVRQNVIAPTPGEINDVLYSRSLIVDSNPIDVLVTEDGNVVMYFDGEDNVCFAKHNGGLWQAEMAYYDQIVEASALDPVSIGCTVADGVYTIKYGFNTYVMDEDSLTPEVAEWVRPVGLYYKEIDGTKYLVTEEGKFVCNEDQQYGVVEFYDTSQFVVFNTIAEPPLGDTIEITVSSEDGLLVFEYNGVRYTEDEQGFNPALSPTVYPW